jgi:hypothetical protein
MRWFAADCVIASEVLDEREFPKIAVEVISYLRIVSRLMPARKLSIQRASARHRTAWSAPEPHVG